MPGPACLLSFRRRADQPLPRDQFPLETQDQAAPDSGSRLWGLLTVVRSLRGLDFNQRPLGYELCSSKCSNLRDGSVAAVEGVAVGAVERGPAPQLLEPVEGPKAG
jgi:hypothetical protein